MESRLEDHANKYAQYLMNLLIHKLGDDYHVFHSYSTQKMMQNIFVNAATGIQSIRMCLQKLYVPVEAELIIPSKIR